METDQEWLERIGLGDFHELIRTPKAAARAWEDVTHRIANSGKADLLGNPFVLDLGCRRGVLLDSRPGSQKLFEN